MTDPQVARSTFQTVLGRPVNDREIARMMAGYLERLPIEVETSAGYRVLEGVSELLPRLCRDGFLLGLTTGALEAAAHIKLARGDLNKLFCFGGTARTRQTDPHSIDRAGTMLGRPIDPREVIVVGDTPLDVEAARTAGAISVAVASGRYGRDELEWCGADHVLGALGELLALRGSRAQGGGDGRPARRPRREHLLRLGTFR